MVMSSEFVYDFLPSAVDRALLNRLLRKAKRPLRGNHVVVYVSGFTVAQNTFLRFLERCLGNVLYNENKQLLYKNLTFDTMGDVKPDYVISVTTCGQVRPIYRNGKIFVARSYPEEDNSLIEAFQCLLCN
jgi:hypothetical protein